MLHYYLHYYSYARRFYEKLFFFFYVIFKLINEENISLEVQCTYFKGQKRDTLTYPNHHSCVFKNKQKVRNNEWDKSHFVSSNRSETPCI